MKYTSVQIPEDLYEQFGRSPMTIRDELWRIVRGRERTSQGAIENEKDADRHASEVIYTEDEPTGPQIQYITELADELGVACAEPTTRIEASELINDLKVRLAEKRLASKKGVGPSDKQLTLINRLLDQRAVPLKRRREIRAKVDDDITKADASALIEELIALPKIEAENES